MLFLKPIIRTTFLSAILAFLLIFLGIKYHWGGYLKSKPQVTAELKIPEMPSLSLNQNEALSKSGNIQVFEPQIISEDKSLSLISSMNKGQIEEQCINLLSRSINDRLSLDLAVANCVVSNYQATLQNSEELVETSEVKTSLIKLCGSEVSRLANHSLVEKQLLIGICVSDQLAK